MYLFIWKYFSDIFIFNLNIKNEWLIIVNSIWNREFKIENGLIYYKLTIIYWVEQLNKLIIKKLKK